MVKEANVRVQESERSRPCRTVMTQLFLWRIGLIWMSWLKKKQFLKYLSHSPASIIKLFMTFSYSIPIW